MPPPMARHGSLVYRIISLLADFLRQRKLGAVFSGSGFLLSDEPAVVRAPDVAFVRADRAAHMRPDEYFQGAPDLAIEVVSPSEVASELMRKVRQYLRAGSDTVWVVYPRTEEVHVFEASGAVRVLTGQQLLEAPEILPGFSAPVSALLE